MSTNSTESKASRARPRYTGHPKLGAVMIRPRWILALLLALAVAGGFAWLGQWQLSYAVTIENESADISETARPIGEVADAGAPVTDRAGGMVVSARGTLVPGDFEIIERRTNGDEVGAWVTGHMDTDDGALALAIGWAPTAAQAQAAGDALERTLTVLEDETGSRAEVSIEGRYMPSDAAVIPAGDEDPMVLLSMVPAQLVNLWEPFDGAAHTGFVVLHPAEGGAQADADAPADGVLSTEVISADALAAIGLDPIDSVPPLPVETINWLNLFYAIEWVVFAGFAVYFWYRLTRDAWEKEHEQQLSETDR